MSDTRKEIDNEKIKDKISKTGFELEYKVTRELEENNWIVINSKYYIDDISDQVREVDIVAYKATKIEDIMLFTALIISCKKSDDKYWSFLCMDKNPNDPNINWQPVDKWTNSREFEYYFNNTKWKEDYLSASDLLRSEIFDINKHIFAFQELNKGDFTARNDSSIYNSITSLIKAMGYELKNLPERRKKIKCLYNFNLLSVVDSSLIEIYFNNAEIESEFVDDQRYVGSFIVNKEEIFSRIHFIDWDNFTEKLSAYNELHEHNVRYFREKLGEFYATIFEDSKKTGVFKSDFSQDLFRSIKLIGDMFNAYRNEAPSDVRFEKDSRNNLIILLDGVTESFIDKLNDDNRLEKKTNNLVKEYFNYDGNWRFKKGLPF